MRWNNLVQSLPSELLWQAPVPNEWSALECFQHILDTEQWVFPVRVKAILAGQDLPAYDPDSQGTKITTEQSPLVLATNFANMRGESLSLLSQVNSADLDKKARHLELGIVTLGELIHEWAGHDLMHTVQAERALMQPFIRGCGPWQSYFTDHVAKSS